MLLGTKASSRLAPNRDVRHCRRSSAPSGTSSSGDWVFAASALSSSSSAAGPPARAPECSILSAATSAISAVARASSLRPWPADLLRGGVAAAWAASSLDGGAPPLVELDQLAGLRLEPAPFKAAVERVGVLANPPDVIHATSRIRPERMRWSTRGERTGPLGRLGRSGRAARPGFSPRLGFLLHDPHRPDRALVKSSSGTASDDLADHVGRGEHGGER